MVHWWVMVYCGWILCTKNPLRLSKSCHLRVCSQVQLPPSRHKGGCGYSVVSNSRGSLERKKLVGKNQRTYPKLSVLWWKPPIPWKCSKFETRGSLFDSEFFSENPNQQFCGCIRKLLPFLNFRKTKNPKPKVKFTQWKKCYNVLKIELKIISTQHFVGVWVLLCLIHSCRHNSQRVKIFFY